MVNYKSEYQALVARAPTRLKTANNLSATFFNAGASVALVKDTKEISITGTVGPYKFSVDLWALSNLHEFTVDWYGDGQYPEEFLKYVQSINPYHRRKASGQWKSVTELEYYVASAIKFLSERVKQ